MEHVGEFTPSGKNDYTPITINGVEVTIFKRWTLALVKREADGEALEMASTRAWREVLGYDSSTTAKEVMAEIERIRSAA